ncbi:hypothetical protein F8388_013699 [Cannabis sativa]|uniref:Ubiquitin-like protease family profile domain-containing protein n=1 Tax=Cannabis sativa TaxID=3483 RepID=A0A7J6EKN5_CANSA|nr:hypothetical protein G4B88_015090 [Cannabis sativa]KAF4358895.1 hypothetical protein F8388_013699 [Cannabis sativa]
MQCEFSLCKKKIMQFYRKDGVEQDFHDIQHIGNLNDQYDQIQLEEEEEGGLLCDVTEDVELRTNHKDEHEYANQPLVRMIGALGCKVQSQVVTVLLLHDKDKVYLKGKDKIVPPFRFGVEDVATKMWFHKLAYPGQCLTNSTESHWILGRLNIEERRMYMYNSLSTAMKDSAAIKACQPFAVLLPHFFALFDEFKKENKPVCLDPFEVVKVDGLPQQTSNDCGCFVASFAEYFIDMKPIPPIFDVEKHRDRLAVLFYKYARMKELDFIDSEDEAPPKGPKKNLS